MGTSRRMKTKMKLTILAFLLCLCNAAQGLSFPYEGFTRAVNEGEYIEIYSLFDKELKAKVSQDEFLRLINREWKLKEMIVLYEEEYDNVAYAIIKVQEGLENSNYATSYRVLFLTRENSRWKLSNFPFLKAGALGFMFGKPTVLE
jgi:hypothetical protein